MIHLVTDSTASVPPELVKQREIHVVPQIVNFSGEIFRAGVDLTIFRTGAWSRLSGCAPSSSI